MRVFPPGGWVRAHLALDMDLIGGLCLLHDAERAELAVNAVAGDAAQIILLAMGGGVKPRPDGGHVGRYTSTGAAIASPLP